MFICQKFWGLVLWALLISSWNAVSSEAIVIWFRKAEISCSWYELTQADGNYAYKELNESLSRLKEVNPTEYEMSTEELLRLGDSVCTTETSDRRIILSSPASNGDDGENKNNIVEEYVNQ